jgi:hypothetical protein
MKEQGNQPMRVNCPQGWGTINQLNQTVTLVDRTVYNLVRRAQVHRFPYHLYFAVTGRTVRIVACVHEKRDPNT